LPFAQHGLQLCEVERSLDFRLFLTLRRGRCNEVELVKRQHVVRAVGTVPDETDDHHLQRHPDSFVPPRLGWPWPDLGAGDSMAHRLDQLVLGLEVISNQAGTDSGPIGDTRERHTREPSGYGVDR
jgi:hypothetical protein